MKNDGGPAFARPTFIHSRGCGTGYYVDGTNGMSLRDWFAGKALMGLLVHDANTGAFAYYAAESYRFADAMIAEREKP